MAQPSRKPYRNLSGDSPVRYYAITPTAILVWFDGGAAYEYDYDRPGRAHVEAMQRLAENGEGLAAYISQRVKSYARKF